MELTDVELDAMLDGKTSEELEWLYRLAQAQIMTIKAARLHGNEEVLHVGDAVMMAMRNDMDAPIEQIAHDALLILGLQP